MGVNDRDNHLAVTVCFILDLVAVACAQTCPDPFGSVLTNPISGSSNKGLFLNVDNPAPCSGTVIAWHFCYYSLTEETRHKASFAVYRESSDGNDYEELSESYIVVTRHGPDRRKRQSSNFFCEDISLPLEDQFEVRVGDILGACLVDKRNDKPLPIQADSATGLRLFRPDFDTCQRNSLSTIDQGDLVQFGSAALHLYADIMQDVTSTTTRKYTSSSTSSMHSMATVTTDSLTSGLDATSTHGTSTSPATSSLTITSTLASDTSSPEPTITHLGPEDVEGNDRDNHLAELSTALFIGVASSATSRTTITSAYTSDIFFPEPTITLPEDMGENNRDNNLSAALLTGVASSVVFALVVAILCVFVLLLWVRKQKKAGIKRHHDYYVEMGSASLPHLYEELEPEHTIALGRINELALPNTTDDRYSAHYYKELEQAVCNSVHFDEEKYVVPASSEQELYDQFRRHNLKRIPEKEIKIGACLGSGQFGNVRQGTWKASDQTLKVAMKTLSSEASAINRVKFLQEAAIMGQFIHPNVIHLYGVVTSEGVIMLVMELASRGDLKNNLISMSPDPGQLVPPHTPYILLHFSQQIAFGMQYLASKGFVHRDLAARNILLSEGNICKIADFGMSRELANEDYYVSQGGKIPIKWTAPEAIHYRKFSTASDVWSYGCLLYEIWSLGKTPFRNNSHEEALEKLESGYRLSPPPGCPEAIYKLMVMCWHPESSHRPVFRDILIHLLEPEGDVLKILAKDASTREQAKLLGSPLEAGEEMYPDLQRSYYTPSS